MHWDGIIRLISRGFFAQLGRQSLIYDDARILGGLDWNVAGRYHDALKLGYANKNNEVHLLLAFNQNNDNRTSGGTYYCLLYTSMVKLKPGEAYEYEEIWTLREVNSITDNTY